MSDLVYRQTARIGQALASPQRSRALNFLAQRSCTVDNLVAELGESKALTSAHLKVLRGACLVTDKRRGREMWCVMARRGVRRLRNGGVSVKRLAAGVAEWQAGRLRLQRPTHPSLT